MEQWHSEQEKKEIKGGRDGKKGKGREGKGEDRKREKTHTYTKIENTNSNDTLLFQNLFIP